jgi:hypothetical protein
MEDKIFLREMRYDDRNGLELTHGCLLLEVGAFSVRDMLLDCYPVIIWSMYVFG